MVRSKMDGLRELCDSRAKDTGVEAQTDILRGRPADALLELSERVDLLVIGSRHWGPVARLLLGSTGEALAHDAACPLMVVPRPAG
jgi:nucleotide-binding universal stress UspA family protein